MFINILLQRTVVQAVRYTNVAGFHNSFTSFTVCQDGLIVNTRWREVSELFLTNTACQG